MFVYLYVCVSLTKAQFMEQCLSNCMSELAYRNTAYGAVLVCVSLTKVQFMEQCLSNCMSVLA